MSKYDAVTSGLQPRQLSESIEVQASQKDRIRLIESNLEGLRGGTIQVSLKVGGFNIV